MNITVTVQISKGDAVSEKLVCVCFGWMNSFSLLSLLVFASSF